MAEVSLPRRGIWWAPALALWLGSCMVAPPADPAPDLSCRETSVVPLDPVAEGQVLWRRGGAGPQVAEVVETAGGAVAEVAFPAGSPTAIFYRPIDLEVGRRFALEMEVTFDGFDDLSRASFGWQGAGRFWLDRLRHVRQGQPYRLVLTPGSIAFGLANDWAEPASWSPQALRVVVEGTPGPDARVRLGPARLRLLPDPAAGARIFGDCVIEEERLSAWLDGRIEAQDEELSFYDLWLDLGLLRPKDSVERADAFRDDNEIRLKYLPPIAGVEPGQTPEGVSQFTTLRFRWQALDLAETLLIAYRMTDETDYLDLARDQVRYWIDRETGGPPSDPKYTWYDHGTAERQVALLLVWEALVERGEDRAFLLDLVEVIRRQAELLASPSFYARNQPTRYHNHAIFQDLALLATVEVMPEWPGSKRWRSQAIARLLEQFDALVVAGEGAWVENSASYQNRTAITCRSVRALLAELQVGESLDEMSAHCAAMDRFFSEISYPDGTWPAYGDTGRFPNSRREPGGGFPVEPLERLFPESGYAVFRRPGDGRRGGWQLDVFAPDQSITHKHADDLSFTLWMDGTEWLIDPGFFAYGDSPHALYGRTAPAHNAVVVGGRDYEPGVGQTDLSWAGDAPGRSLVGRHRGYAPVVVERRFTPDEGGASIVIADRLVTEAGTEAPPAEVWFHAGDGIEVELGDGGVASLVRTADGRRMTVEPGWAARCEAYTGHEGERLAGWFYPAFGEMAPTTSWVCRAPGASWTTTLLLDPDGALD